MSQPDSRLRLGSLPNTSSKRSSSLDRGEGRDPKRKRESGRDMGPAPLTGLLRQMPGKSRTLTN